MATKRAAALYRVSTAKQVKQDDEDAIPVQKHAIEKYVREHGWTLVHEYLEPGVSAYSLSFQERQVLQQALADAKSGMYDVFLVFKSDRLSRNSLEYPLILKLFHLAGVEVIAVAENRELIIDDQLQKLLRFVEGWQAETESNNTSTRVKAAMLDLAQRGRWTGGKVPYGYRLSEKKGESLQIDPEEARVLTEIVRLYLEEGMGSRRIAEHLNTLGIKTKLGKMWNDTNLRRTLQNPIIAGLPAYNRTKQAVKARSRVRRPWDIYGNPEIIIPRDENGNPAPVKELEIIPLDTWWKLMTQMHAGKTLTRRPGRPPSDPLLLTGFLKCGYCGRGFVSSNVCEKGRPNRKVYRCATKRHYGSRFCSGQGQYSREKVEGIFMKELETFLAGIDLGDPTDYLKGKMAAARSRARAEMDHLRSELRKAQRRLDSWTERLNAYFAEPGNSLYSEEFLARELAKAQKDVQSLTKQIGDLQAEVEAEAAEQAKVASFARIAPHWFEIFKKAPTLEKKKMLEQIIDHVTLWRDRMEIVYNVNLLEMAELAGEEVAGTPEPFSLKAVARIG